jgi:acyl-CoA thioesterase-1
MSSSTRTLGCHRGATTPRPRARGASPFGRIGLGLLVASLTLAACGIDDVSPAPTVAPTVTLSAAAQLRYVALGDSYTIGTSVTEAERWPNQLAAKVPGLDLVSNLGVNGYTSDDVIRNELPQVASRRPQVVSLLIGVNDVVQGVPEATYRANVVTILDRLVALVGAGNVVVVTIPDYTVTPAGGDFGDREQQSMGIQANNRAMTELATARGIAVVDIYDISLDAGTDRSLVAGDGLHPSGAQYARWVDRIRPAIEAILRR